MKLYRYACLVVVVLSGPLQGEEVLSPVPEGRVERAQFTSAIEDREPVDRLVVVSPPLTEVYFFTDLRRLENRTVIHRWEYRGQMVSQVPFEVAGPRWRVFSKKVLAPEQLGEWSVTVIDESGWPLHTELFHYEPAAPVTEPLSPGQVPVSE